MSKENNIQTIPNIASKLDVISNKDTNPLVAYPSSDSETSLIETSNIHPVPTSPTNLPATTSTTTKPAIQNAK